MLQSQGENMLLNGEFLQDFSKKKPPFGKTRVTLRSQEIVWGGFSTKGHGDMSFSLRRVVVPELVRNAKTELEVHSGYFEPDPLCELS